MIYVLPTKTIRILAATLLALGPSSATLLAHSEESAAQQTSDEQSAASSEELAKQLANPNGALASLTFRNQFRWYDGDLSGAGDQSNYTLLFQPTLPFPLKKKGHQITLRPAFPLIFDQPVISGSGLANVGSVQVPQPPSAGVGDESFGSESGLGDIGLDAIYGISTETGLIYGFGAFLSMPTATSDVLGTRRWTLGPDLMLGKVRQKTVLFTLVSHQVDVAGSGDKDVSLTTLTLAGIYLPAGGWNVGTSPIINYDWEGEQWTVPLNFLVGKTVVLGGRPWKLQGEVNYYIEAPDAFGAEWMVAFNISPVVQNTLTRLFD